MSCLERHLLIRAVATDVYSQANLCSDFQYFLHGQPDALESEVCNKAYQRQECAVIAVIYARTLKKTSNWFVRGGWPLPLFANHKKVRLLDSRGHAPCERSDI